MQPVDTRIKQLDVLPLTKYYMDKLGLYGIFDKYVPNKNGAEIAPAQVLCMMVMNIINASRPLYLMENWLEDYLDGVTERRIEAGKYNDDRLARNLDWLFGADRNSMLADVSKTAMDVYALEVDRIHNDTTSITFSGAYDNPEEEAVKLKVGYNKDHRPDCKQIVFGLNITEDGHVPLSFQLYDGNRADVTTHRPNWEGLRKLLGKEDFIYVADSKLCSLETLGSIAEHGGLFVTVMPRNYKEVVQFLGRVRAGEEIEWQHTYSTPNSRKKGAKNTYRIHAGESCRDGYRMLWVYSSNKKAQVEKSREHRLEKAEEKLQEAATKLNTRNLKTRAQIENKIATILTGCGELILVDIIEQKQTKLVKVGRGRPGANSRYEEREQLSYRLQWRRDEEAIAKVRRTDGLFPLIDNTTLEPIEVLQTYKKQPYLEKRFHTSKSVLEVAPIFLKTPHRIEAMLFLYFIALMLVSLIERTIRKEMKREKIDALPIRPSGLSTKAPTWNNLQLFFRNIHLAMVIQGKRVVMITVKGVSQLHAELLRLLKVPIQIYAKLKDGWWAFAP